MPLNFETSPVAVARELLGWTLLVDGVGGIIVETEAYDADDAASHSFGGRRSARNAAMFGPPGHAYVYLSYGLHWCLNFVCREAGHGAAVLVRALQPTQGLDVMRARRGQQAPRLLASGPGRVGQALGIDRSFDGLPLAQPPFELVAPARAPDVTCGARIGITKAADLPWRFGIAGSPYLSKPFNAARPTA
ncbi:MAG: DNA-3-methyladenine glycosylase [Rubrivivax sp.]|nr:MAG: DNA-3-methyladenine glycosylase [Rubrivivax sp.]